jgi:hypothetical protein
MNIDLEGPVRSLTHRRTPALCRRKSLVPHQFLGIINHARLSASSDDPARTTHPRNSRQQQPLCAERIALCFRAIWPQLLTFGLGPTATPSRAPLARSHRSFMAFSMSVAR